MTSGRECVRRAWNETLWERDILDIFHKPRKRRCTGVVIVECATRDIWLIESISTFPAIYLPRTDMSKRRYLESMIHQRRRIVYVGS